MILERLRDFHTCIEDELIPRHHKDQDVAYILEVDNEGEFVGFVKADLQAIGPASYRTSHILPHFPIDKGGYVLGIPKSESEGHQDRALKMHEKYVQLAKEASESVGDNHLEAYVRFLRKSGEEAREEAIRRGITYDDFLMPRIESELLEASRQPDIRDFWQAHMDHRLGDRGEFFSECIVCGEKKPIADLHSKISGIGSQQVGLILADKMAYRSYGLKKSEVAPVCFTCADIYTQALQYLISKDQHNLRLADVTWAYWTDEPVDFNPFGALSDAEPRDVETLLKSAFGTQPAEIETNSFYALALTSNISRLAVRNWLTTTVAEVKRHLAHYFERQRLVGRNGVVQYHGLYALAGSLVRDLNDLSPQVLPVLLEHALLGRPLPQSLLHQAVQRARVDEHTMTHPRAALIKLVLLSNQTSDDEPMVDEQLKPNHESPAYQCGRLLALLDDIQRAAISPNTTLVDRYYGTASTAPASVFGSLLRGVQSHLSKLRRTKSKRGLHHYYQEQLGEIMSHLNDFPNTLSSKEQGLFALGFYQQKHRPKQNAEAAEA